MLWKYGYLPAGVMSLAQTLVCCYCERNSKCWANRTVRCLVTWQVVMVIQIIKLSHVTRVNFRSPNFREFTDLKNMSLSLSVCVSRCMSVWSLGFVSDLLSTHIISQEGRMPKCWLTFCWHILGEIRGRQAIIIV